jgi:Protein of unknown function (DUF2585)
MQTSELSHGPGRNTVLALTALMVLAMAAVLFVMGRIPICACGTVKLWHGVVNSGENSQHLLDWYTPSHIIHGALFFTIFVLLRRWCGATWPLAWGFIAALGVEILWEIVENTPAMIDRYRTATISLGYTGDSIINSVMDVLSMMLGFYLAATLPVRLSMTLVLLAEIGVAYVIRDNLVLNILMLVWPMDWVRTWQAGA